MRQSENAYLVVVTRTPRNYGAYSPDVPGCVATGRTSRQALSRMRSALKLHLAGLAEDGLPLPKPSARAEVVRLRVQPATPRRATRAR